MGRNEIDFFKHVEDNVPQDEYLKGMMEEHTEGGYAEIMAFVVWKGFRVVVIDPSYPKPLSFPDEELEHLVTQDGVIYLLRIGEYHYELLEEIVEQDGDVSALSDENRADPPPASGGK